MIKRLNFLKSIGPAVIVAAMVCGPGSILTSSKVGAQYGMSMIWILAFACLMMWALISLSSQIGLVYEHSPNEELARRLGRPVAILVGVILFLVVAAFQSSNNLAILAAVEPFLGHHSSDGNFIFSAVILVSINSILIMTIYKFHKLYKPIESVMKGIVLLVMTAFLINFFIAQPSLLGMLKGFIPSLPVDTKLHFMPYLENGVMKDDLLVLQALIATTFSVAGAYYQAYLVREKGFKLENLKQRRIDSLIGVSVLGGISLIIMSTAAASFAGKENISLNSLSDISKQLEPLFGSSASLIFSVGILAGGLGAFFVNAILGGNLLSDGFGWGSHLSDKGARHCTVAALIIGMSVALSYVLSGQKPVGLIIFAQALTVLGLPILCLAMIYLGTRPELTGNKKIPGWNLMLACIGFILTLILACRTGYRLWYG